MEKKIAYSNSKCFTVIPVFFLGQVKKPLHTWIIKYEFKCRDLQKYSIGKERQDTQTRSIWKIHVK